MGTEDGWSRMSASSPNQPTPQNGEKLRSLFSVTTFGGVCYAPQVTDNDF